MTDPRPFASVLADINYGEFADQLAEETAELVRAVTTNNRKGSITVTLEIAPRKGGRGLNVTGRHNLKLPQAEPVESVFFPDADGNLHRDDPRQTSIGELVDLNSGTTRDPIKLREA
ncbi:hypothetical protein EDD29_0125 [Actinocorallia herbida]|uniref:Uncharacterized protein n=1 Tax=Actinocorallia herbida TaxID=58109 RepID=A0A3N1CNB5_9ACTN|nr:hypothetical protein [Actinocorallia herbida]ROO82644.1 hypothetical protein EDD29_0125 [Actinocorallia herbida]